MATKKKMLQAAAGNAGGAGGAGGAALNVEDVFSTYLYKGNGGSQVIQNGIFIGDNAEATQSNTEPSSLRSGTVDGFFATSSSYGIFNTTSAGENLTVDFGGEVVITQTTYKNDVGADWAPTEVLIQSSDDGLSWTTRNTYTDANNSNLQTINISGGGSGRYWRIYQNTATRGGTSGYEWHMNNFSMSGAAAAGVAKGGLVWIKSRTESTYGGHALFDTERGPNKVLTSSGDSGVSATMAEFTSPSTSQDLTSFNSNGFSLGPDYYFNKNTSGEDYASWTFRKAPKFFTCVTWSGDGTSNRAIPHDLGGAVGSYFVKCTNAATASDWIVWHKDLPLNSDNLVLNTTAAQDNYNLFSTTAPDSSNVYLGTANLDYFNATGRTYVAYIFAHNNNDGKFGPDGDADIIKCGSYTGTSAAGNFIDLGFEPQWVLIKNTNLAAGWSLYDNMRGVPTGGKDKILFPNTSGVEEDTGVDNDIDFNATGFTLQRTTQRLNTSSNTYIYIAIRRGTKVPESGTEVYNSVTRSGTGTAPWVASGAGFPPDMSIMQGRNLLNFSGPSSYGNSIIDRVRRATEHIQPINSNGEGGGWDAGHIHNMDGYDGLYSGDGNYYNANGGTYVDHHFRRAPNFLDIVAYTSTATSGNPQTESHNLGVVPEMMWVKCRNTATDWQVYHADLGVSKKLILNSTSAEVSAGVGAWNTAPTNTSFTVGDDSEFGGGGRTYIAYLFSSLDGISKVGSFSHATGTPTNVDCGFANGARFVLWKKYSNTDGWQVYDTTRGIVSGSDPFLQLNSAVAEITNEDLIDPLSSGFTVSANKNSGDYIFYAIA